MTADYPVDEVPATPEYVFDLLRPGGVGSAARYDAVADEPAEAHVKTWWLQATDELYDWYGIDVPLDEVLEFDPQRRRTVREVCEFLAGRMTRPMIRPWRHVGGECLPAGAFLTVRSMLAARGANPNRIAPSTRLRRYWAWYGPTLLSALHRLAPGRTPGRDEPMPWRPFLCVTLPGALLILLTLLGKAGVDIPVGLLLAEVFGGFAVCLFGMVRLQQWEYRKDLGDLVTFRDLAYRLAGQEPRRRIQPTP
jgi:hypothetical protein